MPMIRETIVSTMNASGKVHFASNRPHCGRKRLDYCAVLSVDNTEQFAQRAIRGCKLY